MKIVPLLAMFLAAVFLGLPRPLAAAFHQQGVASCAGCHTVHNSQDGQPVNPDVPGGVDGSLIRANATDVCLSCHAEGPGAVLGRNPLQPPPERGGGNFVYLLEDNINDAPDGGSAPIRGNRAGHNVVSPGWGIEVDPDNATAPGGSFPASTLSCTSCHDPHGNTNFRMLRGRGPVGSTGYSFVHPAPIAQGVDLFSEQAEGRTNHTAYQDGWANWCGNCHGRFHHGGDAFPHPDFQGMPVRERRTYNGYDGPLAWQGGEYATAYIPQTPLEDLSSTVTGTFGAGAGSKLTCMSCHRAHATSAPHALRWDPNVQFLYMDGLASGSYAIPSPYPRPEQRALCVKCHYATAESHGFAQPCLECHR